MLIRNTKFNACLIANSKKNRNTDNKNIILQTQKATQMIKTYDVLDYQGEKTAAAKIKVAVIEVLKEGKVRTADLGGTATTNEKANVIVAHIKL